MGTSFNRPRARSYFRPPFALLFNPRVSPEAFGGCRSRALRNSNIASITQGGVQGLIGWWMVKSGLVEKRNELDKTPRVSPYRLTVHAGFAYAIYGVLVWYAMTLLRPIQEKIITPDNFLATMKTKRFIHRWAGAYFVVLISGFFMAGTDSGKACQTFPKLGHDWVLHAKHFNHDIALWKNFSENKIVVHFNHRTAAVLLYAWALSKIGVTL